MKTKFWQRWKSSTYPSFLSLCWTLSSTLRVFTIWMPKRTSRFSSLKLPIQLIFRSSFWNCLFEARRPGLCIYRPTPRVDNCNANGSLLLRSVTLLQCWNPLREMYIVDTDSPRRKLIRTTPTDMNYRSLSSCTWVLSKSSFLLIS